MSSGEGGIFCSNDQALTAECDSLLWAGRKVGRPWYEHHRLGWNYRLTEFQGAILRCQLKRLDEQIRLRMKNGDYLSEQLSQIDGVSPIMRDSRTTLHGYYVYMFRYDQALTGLPRDTFLRALAAEGVPVFNGYEFPLYKNPMFLNKRFINGSFPLGTPYHEDMDYAAFEHVCPVSERACKNEAVWLPQNVFLGTEADMNDIAAAVRKILDHRDSL